MAEFEAAKKTVWDNVREGADAACTEWPRPPSRL